MDLSTRRRPFFYGVFLAGSLLPGTLLYIFSYVDSFYIGWAAGMHCERDMGFELRR